MKRTILLIFLVLLYLRIFAEPVNISDATDVAEFYLELYYDSLEVDNVVEFKDENNTTVAYIANLSSVGFIALSINTDIQPIVCYSIHNDFIFDTDPENILYHMLLNDMIARIDAMTNVTLPNVSDNNTLWTHYLNNNYSFFNQRDPQQWPEDDSGWLETTWSQGYPYYNFCPISPTSGNRSVVGCTATACSQILNYHKYIGNRIWTTENDGYISKENQPGEVYIDQDAELYDFPYFEESNASYLPINSYLNDLRIRYAQGLSPITDQKSALCFIAGVACEMNYSSGGSGGYASENYFIEKFEYDYAEEFPTWIPNHIKIPNLIMDMKNAQPAELILQCNPMSHSVVCDGYRILSDTEEYFHINFGWGYSNPVLITEAWYNLPELFWSSIYLTSFVAHICPPGFNGTVSGNIQLLGGNGNVEDVIVTVGYKETHPDAEGNYELEIYNGNYDVKAYLFGYEESVIEEITVITNEITENIDIELQVHVTEFIYIPTHYSTIQEGIDAAEDGDIVIVLPATYFENINFNGKKIQVTSFYHFNQNENYIDNTIISGYNVNDESKVVLFNNGEDMESVLNGFTITEGNTTENYNGSGIECFGSSPTLKNLNIVNNTGLHGSAIYLRYSNAILENIDVHSNHNNCTEGAVVHFYYSDATVKNLLVFGNMHRGVSTFRSNVTITNSSIYGNGLSGNNLYGVIVYFGSIDLINCLIWGNNAGGIQIDVNQNPEITITFSDIQGGWQGTGNINVEPLLHDNYQPKWTATEFSPLIDTGVPSIFDPDETPSDIGAVRAINHKVDTIELIDMIEGINWLCFPVLDTVFTDADIAANVLYDIMLPPYPAALNLVETQNHEYDIEFLDPGWSNDNQQFTSVKGYKVHMNQPFNLDVTGFLESPLTTINLFSGTGGQENWIGFFPEESMKPLDALEAVLDNIDMIQTRSFTMFKTDTGWGLSAHTWTLNYGDLVVVNCTEDCSFYWGEQGGGSVPKNERSSSEGFSYDEEADYIPVFVELDPEVLGYPTEIGIFVENECKGAEVIEDSLVQIRAYVLNDSMVFDPGMVEFQLYYGLRSENLLIDSYSIKDNLDDAGNIEKLDFSQNPQRYYIISLTDSGNNVPEIIKTSLEQNFPNPFNPETIINYSISDEGSVELEVYNIKGQKVKILINEMKEPGHYQAIWDGTDNNKKQVASGIYLYQLSTGKKTLNKKMLLLK